MQSALLYCCCRPTLSRAQLRWRCVPHSALMTATYVTDNTHCPIIDMETGAAATPLDFGAGHINPNEAMDPGLAYDIEYQDYVNFLCGLHCTSKQIKIITRKSNYTCTKASVDLNYPAFAVILNNSTNLASAVFNRVLTNVADSPSVYLEVVEVPTGMRVEVAPPQLKFDGKYSKQAFTVAVEIDVVAVNATSDEFRGNFGYLIWYEKGGSPIVSVLEP